MAREALRPVRGEHAGLVAQAEALCRLVGRHDKNEPLPFDEVRRQAARLLEALRRHQAGEADLIFETFYTDIGAGD